MPDNDLSAQIQYHPAFVNSLEIPLWDYLDQIVKKIKEESIMCEALRELMQDEFLEYGRHNRIKATVETMIYDSRNENVIIKRLMSRFELSEDDARKALKPQKKPA